eukprot:TRINITY_DN8863_c0_g1_i1.p1 TRINITY_DN8863_c0_g1~~TRINITY_DN8863_c0_g1_i1.p1  ORF type:complete len:483 (+),score=160.56 TRINITY_DN8863_c0_g1_i1:23-1471(+)
MQSVFRVAAVAVLVCVFATSLTNGDVIQVDDSNFEQTISQYEVVLVNFYADWCRFCQMLKPVYKQAGQLFSEGSNARLAQLDCENPGSQNTKNANGISKYPTIKVFRNGKALRSEYRGPRTPTAIEAFVRELLAPPVIQVSSEAELDQLIQKHHKVIVGHFNAKEHAHYPIFEQVAQQMRDDCHFVAWVGSPQAGDKGASILFKTRADEHPYEGELGSIGEYHSWATNEAIPLVREITFANGEELTEEGLPFIILFYSPSDMHAVQQFSRIVRAHMEKYRGKVNFITADGTVFTHPLQHLGKTKSDLPILAADTFRHMYLFKNFKRIHRPNVLDTFIDDVLTGRIHQALHNPALRRNDGTDPYADEYNDYEDEPEPGERKDTIREKLEEAQEAKVEKEINAQKVKQAEQEAKRGAEEFVKERKEQAIAQGEQQEHKLNEVAENAAEEHEEVDDEHHVPVRVRSVMDRLKPSSNRYSLVRDEL